MIPAGLDLANTPDEINKRKPFWVEEKDVAVALQETEANKKKFCGVLAEILNRKIDKDEDGKVIPLTNEDLMKVFAYNLKSSHAGLMDELKQAVKPVEAGVEHHVPPTVQGWKAEKLEETNTMENKKNKLLFEGVLMDLLKNSKRVDENGNEIPLSAEELLKIATTKAKVDFKKAMDDLRVQKNPVPAGIDHHHGTITKQVEKPVTIEHEDLEHHEGDVGAEGMTEVFPVHSELPDQVVMPEKKYPNLNMAMLELIPGVKIPAPPLDIIGACPVLNKIEEEETSRAQKDNQANYFTVLAELLNKVARIPDKESQKEKNPNSLGENDAKSLDGAEQKDQQKINSLTMDMKANMMKMLGELHDKKKKIEVGDSNEDAAVNGVKKTVPVFNAEDMIHEEDEEDVTVHDAKEVVSLKGLKKHVMNQAIGGFLDKMFGNAPPKAIDEQGEEIPTPPELTRGTVVPPPPPISAGILSEVNEQIVVKMNRDAAVDGRINLLGVLGELLRKVPKNNDNIATSDGEQIGGEAAFEAKKKLDSLSQIHSLFSELKTKVPRLGSDGKTEKKSQEQLNKQYADKWKSQF